MQSFLSLLDRAPLTCTGLLLVALSCSHRYVLLEAELEGAIPILPEAAVEPLDAGGGGGGGVLASLGTLWDLDSYILHLHCLTGVVAVRPVDVEVTLKEGRAPSLSHIDHTGTRRLVGSARLLSRRARPVGGAEHSMRRQLAAKLESSIGPSGGAGGANTLAGADLASTLAMLAQSTTTTPQLATTMLAALKNHSSGGAGMGAMGGGMGAKWDPHTLACDWVDVLWRTHRRALMPSEAVISRASLVLGRLREAGVANAPSGANGGGGAEVPLPLFAMRMLHDAASTRAAAAAAASILSNVNGSFAASASTEVGLMEVAADIELDSSGESTSPMRAVETIQQLAPAIATRGLARRVGGGPAPYYPVLLATPGDLPGMPLLIAAAWSRGLAAYSLPMLLQQSAPVGSTPWQAALAASLQPAVRAVSGHERWLNQATEFIVQVAAEACFGGSTSSEFHDIALFRCDARHAGADRQLLVTANLLHDMPTASSLRRALHTGLIDSALRRQHAAALTAPTGSGPPMPAALLAEESSSLASYSYTTAAMLKCPESGFEMQSPIGGGATTGDGAGSREAEQHELPAEPSATERVSAMKKDGGVHRKAASSAAAKGGGKAGAKSRSGRKKTR